MYQKNLITKIDFGLRDIGEKNFIDDLYNPYEDYLNEPFPSGKINNIKFISNRLSWWWKPNITIISNIQYDVSDKNGSSFIINFGIDIFYGMNNTL